MNDPVRRSALLRCLAAAFPGTVPRLAQAQEAAWPSRPPKRVANFPPGSSPNAVGRAVAPPLARALGQAVVVDNRAGAGGPIGTDVAAKAATAGATQRPCANTAQTEPARSWT